MRKTFLVILAELSVEGIQEPAPQLEAPAPEPEEPAESAEPAEVPDADVSAEVSIPAHKKRGRPPGSKNKPKARPKRRPREPTPELLEPEPPPQIDVNALLEPIFRAYMATGEMRKREARQQRYNALFQGMVG